VPHSIQNDIKFLSIAISLPKYLFRIIIEPFAIPLRSFLPNTDSSRLSFTSVLSFYSAPRGAAPATTPTAITA
jgi:hypothetical protein